MSDQWLFKSETYDNCNCAVNCGCQFNLPTTHGYCQSAFIGEIVSKATSTRRCSKGSGGPRCTSGPARSRTATANARSSSMNVRTKLNG